MSASGAVFSCGAELSKIGEDGTTFEEEEGGRLTMRPAAETDYWSRTFYSPPLKRSNAPALVARFDDEQDFVATVQVEMRPLHQFDQAGLLLRLDDDHWIKCGVEFADGAAHVSAVVCNVFSDWSVRPYTFGAPDRPRFRVRLHKRRVAAGPGTADGALFAAVCIEVAPFDSDDFQLLRIAHVSRQMQHTSVSTPPSLSSSWLVGPYACTPGQQPGFSATFTHFQVSIGTVPLVHQDTL